MFIDRLNRLRWLDLVGDNASRPVVQPLDQLSAASASSVYHGSWWERPITLHIHAANEALEGDQHSVYVREELGMFVLY